MAELTDRVLQYLQENGDAVVDSVTLSQFLGEDHQKVVGAVKSLQSAGNVITAEQQNSKFWELTDEGQEIVSQGSHEALIFHAIPPEGISQAILMKSFPNAKVGFSKAMSSGWIYIDKKAEGGPKVFHKVNEINDEVQKCLVKIRELKVDDVPENMKLDLRKRKLLQEITVKSYKIGKGPDFSISLVKFETDLTSDMIVSGSWKDFKFKPCNLNALGLPPDCGYLHPLMKVRAEFRQIFLEMGFAEMEANNYIESSFWNFDALFQPQQHPARDMHDTFFISDPQFADGFPMDYLERVKSVHSKGGFGSQGYQYDWKIEEAKKNLLRTHTTSVSAKMLYKLAEKKIFTPTKYFSIDKVFRNETLDATHLAEFHQIEGVVAGYNLNLGNLMGILQQFFNKLGIQKIRFKSAYNPYTEPSMEIFSYHEGFKKWVEVGNSGMFRPEMLLPMGLPEDVVVIAWGLSLERPTMIKYNINNIRDLVGHKVNLDMVKSNPLCRLEK